MAATTTTSRNNYTTANAFHNKLLHSSVAKGQLNQVRKLISNDGCDPNLAHSTTGLRPIHFAASRGHFTLVQFLNEQCRVDIDAIDKEGETALLKAAYAGHESVLKYLVEKANANYLVKDNDGWTALHNACSCGNLDMVHYLVGLPRVNVNIQSKQGHTSLMNAASKGYIDIVNLLFTHHANPLLKNRFGETAYDVAAAAGEAYLCQLIEHHQSRFDSFTTPLDMHVTIPVLLLEEQQISTSSSTWYLEDGQIVQNKQTVELPNHKWFWLSDWTIDYTNPRQKDQDGWSFSIDNGVHWSSSLSDINSGSRLKRRQWMRIMKKVVHTMSESESSTSSSSSEEEDDSTSEGIDLHDPQGSSSSSNGRQYRKKTLSSVSTSMTKAQSIFITHPQSLLLLQQEEESIIIPPPPPPSQQLQEDEQEEEMIPTWENNKEATSCRRCQKWFNFIIRRHHCRKCGQIICNSCSQHRVYLPPSDIIIPNGKVDLNQLSCKPQRVCDTCILDVQNEDDIVKKRNKRSSMMMECPVCNMNLVQAFGSLEEQEQHVQSCLVAGPSSTANIGVRFVVYKLTDNSTLIGQECVICFEEFTQNDTITRLNCMCSYHRHCINNWFSKGKECPIHSR